MYIKNIYFVHTLYFILYQNITDYMYNVYIVLVEDTHTLYAVCEVCTAFAIHYKYIVEV